MLTDFDNSQLLDIVLHKSACNLHLYSWTGKS